MSGEYHDGKAVAAAMERREIQPVEVAEVLGVSLSTLYRMLERSDWTARQLRALSLHLNEDLIRPYHIPEPGRGYCWLPDGEGLLRISLEEIERTTEL